MPKFATWTPHRQAAAQAGRARKRLERAPWHDMREPGSMTLRVNGYVFDKRDEITHMPSLDVAR